MTTPRTVLERWRERCEAAVKTGAGLPDRGLFLFRNPDRRLGHGIVKAIAATATETTTDGAATTLNHLIAWTSDRDGDQARGLILARRWLDEERAFEVFRLNGTREGGAS
jgi:hypothetical protein